MHLSNRGEERRVCSETGLNSKKKRDEVGGSPSTLNTSRTPAGQEPHLGSSTLMLQSFLFSPADFTNSDIFSMVRLVKIGALLAVVS